MKKSLIALSLVSVFSAGASAATWNHGYVNVDDVMAHVEKHHTVIESDEGLVIVGGRDGSPAIATVKEVTTNKNAGIKRYSVAKADGGFSVLDVDKNGNIVKVDGIDANRGGGNSVMDATQNAIEFSKNIDKATDELKKDSSKYFAVKDENGKISEVIDATNVDKYVRKFEELKEHEKVAVVNDIKEAVQSGQISEGNKRPDPEEPTTDDAMDWVNDRINGAGREVAVAAAQYDARLDSLEANFNAMAERQHRQEMRINENEGKMSNGIAGVAAMANIPTVSGKTTFGAGVGHFNGSNAIAIGASTGFENGISLKGSLSYAKGKWDQKDVVVGAGIGYSF